MLLGAEHVRDAGVVRDERGDDAEAAARLHEVRRPRLELPDREEHERQVQEEEQQDQREVRAQRGDAIDARNCGSVEMHGREQSRDVQHEEREDEPHREVEPDRVAELARRIACVRCRDTRAGDEDRRIREPEAAIR